MATKKLPPRSKVKTADTWDLSSLFGSDEEWETAFGKWQKQIKKYAAFRGTLGDSPAQLAKLLKFDSKFDRQGERLGSYAFLKTAEDTANSTYQRMVGRYQNTASQAAQAASFIRPEILGLSATKLKKYLASKELAHFKLQLERLAPLQTAYVVRQGRKAAGNAERDVAGSQQSIPPADRRRHEVWRAEEREGRHYRTGAFVVLRVFELA